MYTPIHVQDPSRICVIQDKLDIQHRVTEQSSEHSSSNQTIERYRYRIIDKSLEPIPKTLIRQMAQQKLKNLEEQTV